MSGLSSLIYLVIDVPGTADAIRITPIHLACTVRQIMVAVDAKPTTAVMTIHKTGAINLLAGTNVNLAALTTAKVAEDQTLATGHVDRHLAKGDSIVCTLDQTTMGSCTSIGVVVAIEPDYI